MNAVGGSVTGRWHGEPAELPMRRWAEELRSRLVAPQVDLALVFMTPHYFEHAARILELLRVHARVPLLLGCSSASLICGGEEIEDQSGIVLSLLSLPGAVLKPARFTPEEVGETARTEAWTAATGVKPGSFSGWLTFADPFHADIEGWLKGWNSAFPGMPMFGGLASGDFQAQETQLYLNGDVFTDGGVALAVGGAVELKGVISQGCTPIGETWTLTHVERNFIRQIGNRPAYQVLLDTYNGLSTREQGLARGNLFVGLVVNEYLEEFHRGDFLVRNLLGADPQSGIVAVGAIPRAGQTMQFQRRDAEAAHEDLATLLDHFKSTHPHRRILGACVCSCNGRGERLFGKPHHDAALIQEKLGPLESSGFFCNGEIGPIGDRNFLHGYTAAVALFVTK